MHRVSLFDVVVMLLLCMLVAWSSCVLLNECGDLPEMEDVR